MLCCRRVYTLLCVQSHRMTGCAWTWGMDVPVQHPWQDPSSGLPVFRLCYQSVTDDAANPYPQTPNMTDSAGNKY